MINVLPYCTIDGIPTLRDSELAGLYRRMADEGSAGMAFQEGEDQWVLEMKARRSLLYVILVDGVAGGMLWLNRMLDRYAYCHLVVFKQFWGRKHLAKGREAVLTVLDSRDGQGRHLWDGFIGLIPESNRLAIAYAQACGFEYQGVIPFGSFNQRTDKSEPAVILTLGREG